jgi:hypothetical protein
MNIMNIKTRIRMKNINLLTFGFILMLLVNCSCKKSLPIPVAQLNNSTFNVWEDASGGSISLPVSLSGTYDKPVTVEYSTADGTAIAGKDYTAVSSGTLTIQPGHKSVTLTLNVIQDTASKEDASFKVEFSNPVNCTLSGTEFVVKIQNTDYANMVWSDEFNASPLDQTLWNYELGGGGWGNAELEIYTNSSTNVHIDTGYLHISATKEGGSYYSGRLTTKGKKEFTHCRVDIRAKLPQGKGIWPALWMLGGNISSVGWPACGETDIMELIGQHPSTVYGTVHWNQAGHVSLGGSFDLSGSTFNSGFHTFSLIWAPNHFQWLIDGQPYLYYDKSQVNGFPFDLPQFFIFNVAVGGQWPGDPDGTTVFPQNMIVDYIRVYQ